MYGLISGCKNYHKRVRLGYLLCIITLKSDNITIINIVPSLDVYLFYLDREYDYSWEFRISPLTTPQGPTVPCFDKR